MVPTNCSISVSRRSKTPKTLLEAKHQRLCPEGGKVLLSSEMQVSYLQRSRDRKHRRPDTLSSVLRHPGGCRRLGHRCSNNGHAPFPTRPPVSQPAPWPQATRQGACGPGGLSQLSAPLTKTSATEARRALSAPPAPPCCALKSPTSLPWGDTAWQSPKPDNGPLWTALGPGQGSRKFPEAPCFPGYNSGGLSLFPNRAGRGLPERTSGDRALSSRTGICERHGDTRHHTEEQSPGPGSRQHTPNAGLAW